MPNPKHTMTVAISRGIPLEDLSGDPDNAAQICEDWLRDAGFPFCEACGEDFVLIQTDHVGLCRDCAADQLNAAAEADSPA